MMNNNPLMMQQILANMQKQEQAKPLQVNPEALLLYNLQAQQQSPQGEQIAYDLREGQGRLSGYPMTYATNYFDGSVDKNLLTPKMGAISNAKGYADETQKDLVDNFKAEYMKLNREFRGK